MPEVAVTWGLYIDFTLFGVFKGKGGLGLFCFSDFRLKVLGCLRFRTFDSGLKVWGLGFSSKLDMLICIPQDDASACEIEDGPGVSAVL